MDKRLQTLIASRTASARDLEGIRPEEVRAVKSDPELVQYIAHVEEAKEVNDAARTALHVFTDESIDSDGDLMKVNGWDTERFEKNGVILWAHDSRGVPPIGKSAGLTFEKDANNPFATVNIQYAEKDQHEFADTIFQLVKGGFVKATSPGLRVLEIAELTDEQRMELGIGPYGIKSLRHSLLEISNVALPANENALRRELRTYVDKGIMLDRTRRNFEKTFPLTERDYQKRLKEAVKSFVDMGANLTLDASGRGDKSKAYEDLGDEIEQADGAWILVRRKDGDLETSTLDDLPEGEDALDELTRTVKELQNELSAMRRDIDRSVTHSTKKEDAYIRLVEAMSDLTKRIALMGGNDGGRKPEAVTPDPDGVELKGVSGALTGLADRIARATTAEG